ncbi:MAG TPA: hypothetical protein VF151_04080 [Gemmatimonadales bacterium]
MRVRILMAGVLLAACSGGTEPGAGDRLLVSAASDTLQVDSTVQLHAFIRSGADSVDVPGAVWSSRDPDIASVTEDGIATGHVSGIVTLVALAGDLRGTTELRVERRFRAKDVSTGSTGVCAVDLGGQMWCENGKGSGIPYPAVDTSDIRTFITPVSGTERYTLVGSNQFFACGLSTTKHALCWGYSILWDSLSAEVPTPIAPSVTFDTLSLDGWMGCGLSGITAWCWGAQMRGVRMITNGGANADPPLPLTRLAVQQYGGCGWNGGDGPFCWDSEGYPAGYIQPVEPSPPISPSLHGIANGGSYFCGLDPDGHAWCWGDNSSGQLGNGTTVASSNAVQVGGGHQYRLLATGAFESGVVCGIADSDELFCWGGRFGLVPEAVLF